MRTGNPCNPQENYRLVHPCLRPPATMIMDTASQAWAGEIQISLTTNEALLIAAKKQARMNSPSLRAISSVCQRNVTPTSKRVIFPIASPRSLLYMPGGVAVSDGIIHRYGGDDDNNIFIGNTGLRVSATKLIHLANLSIHSLSGIDSCSKGPLTPRSIRNR